MLRSGMPMEQVRGGMVYAEQKRQARNAEEALLAVLNACARVTEEISHIHWPDLTSAGTWIRFLQEQSENVRHRLARECLSYLDLSGLHLYGIDLYGARLFHSDLSAGRLVWANLARANLARARLEFASLASANLVETY